MPGLRLQTDGFILRRQPANADAFEQLSAFSPDHGTLLVLRRQTTKKNSPSTTALDLFDEAHLDLESPNQGRTWFLKESRLLVRPIHLGQNYATLAAASKLALLIARNEVHEESRAKVGALLRQAFAAFAPPASPEAVYFKSLYCFARDEGYPVKQDWWQHLPAAAQGNSARLLNTPLAELEPDSLTPIPELTNRLEIWLRGHTDILMD